MSENQRFTIEEVAANGLPIAPEKTAKLFVSQCGVIVRDNIPITIRDWNKPKADGVPYVDDRSKDMLWSTLMTNFTLPPEVDPDKVKEWTLQKMAEQFRNHKKRLYKEYVLKKRLRTGSNLRIGS